MDRDRRFGWPRYPADRRHPERRRDERWRRPYPDEIIGEGAYALDPRDEPRLYDRGPDRRRRDRRDDEPWYD
jgi:hypothetical protein